MRLGGDCFLSLLIFVYVIFVLPVSYFFLMLHNFNRWLHDHAGTVEKGVKVEKKPNL